MAYGRVVGKNLKVGNTGRAACRAMLVGQGERTAYEIARLSNYSPQHINRCLKEMWKDGLVCYRLVPHRKGEKRVWAWCYGFLHVEGYINAGAQMEIPL